MQIFILRHGLAEPHRGDDASRALVPEGIAQVERSAAWLLQQRHAVDAIYASPFVRTQETAQALLRKTQWPLTINTESLLLSETDPVLTSAWLSTVNQQRLLLVAHMPLVARLTEELSGQRVMFDTASLAVIDWSNGRGRLLDFFTP